MYLLYSVRSFSDNEEGNKEAEEFFIAVIKENKADISEEDLEICIDEGYYENGNYELALVHS